MNDKILLIVGPSGSGKTTLVDHMEKLYKLTSVDSYTTRAPRYEGETGHKFVSEDEFKLLTDVCAYTYFDGAHYGVTSELVDRSDLYVIDPAGVDYFSEHYNGFKNAVVVFIDVPEDVCRERMLARGDSEEKVDGRIEHDKVAFANAKEKADIVVLNDGSKPISDIACEVLHKTGLLNMETVQENVRQNLTATEIRIQGAWKNIEKTQKTLDRHLNTLAKKKAACLKLGFDPEQTEISQLADRNHHDEYWAYCDYDSAKDNVKNNYKKLDELREKLGEYLSKKKEEDKKNDVPMVPAVEQFLANWKTNAASWYRSEVVKMKTLIDEMSNTRKNIRAKYEPHSWKHEKEIAEEEKEARVDYQSSRKRIAMNFGGDVQHLYEYRGLDFEEKLEKMLSDEVRRKRIDLFRRCAAVAGILKDASGLRIGSDLNLNGVVVGEKGKASVNTIGAGGYNIQCFHYRVLVNPIREKEPLDAVIASSAQQVVDNKQGQKREKANVR